MATKKTARRSPVRAKKTTPKRAAKKRPQARAKKRDAKSTRPRIDLPLLWRVDTSTQAVGLWVDEQCWASNENGEVFAFSKDGVVERSFKLPRAVDCLIADEVWKYAGCADGKVYDLTGRVPRAMYEIGKPVQIDWMSMWRGALCVSDHKGGLFVVDVEGNERWQVKDKKAKEGWMLRVDGDGVYHGSMAGLRHYDWNGKLVWQNKDIDDVRFGWWADDVLVIITGYNKVGATTVRTVTKAGKVLMSAPVSSSAKDFSQDGAESCGAGFTPEGALRVYASTGDHLFCFDDAGTCLWEAPTKMGSACTMQVVDERLYMVTRDGCVACVDVSEPAIAKAKRGSVPKVKKQKLKELGDAAVDVETTADTSKGVVVECVKEGAKLRVRVVSAGYHADWYCQFPRDLRVAGARFVVDEVREATQGGFYRVLGDIKRLSS
jgi:outer membrane protein assembly factor BamB